MKKFLTVLFGVYYLLSYKHYEVEPCSPQSHIMVYPSSNECRGRLLVKEESLRFETATEARTAVFNVQLKPIEKYPEMLEQPENFMWGLKITEVREREIE